VEGPPVSPGRGASRMLRGLMLRTVEIFWARADVWRLLFCNKVITKKVARKSRQKIEGEGDDNTKTTKKRSPKIDGQLLSFGRGASFRLAPALYLALLGGTSRSWHSIVLSFSCIIQQSSVVKCICLLLNSCVKFHAKICTHYWKITGLLFNVHPALSMLYTTGHDATPIFSSPNFTYSYASDRERGDYILEVIRFRIRIQHHHGHMDRDSPRTEWLFPSESIKKFWLAGGRILQWLDRGNAVR